MNVNQIEAELESLESLRATMKARAMVYQASLKEQKAVAAGLPRDAYYDLPYAEWAAIRDA